MALPLELTIDFIIENINVINVILIKNVNRSVPNISKPNLRGDHIVVVSIKTPTHLSGEEKALYQRLYDLKFGKENKNSVKEKLKGVFK